MTQLLCVRLVQGRITPNDLKQRLGAFYKNLPVRHTTLPRASML